MLVPALLAALTLRQVAPPRRLEHLRRARGLFLDFLRLCRDYAVARFDLPREAVDDEEEHGGEAAPAPRDGQASLLAMAAARRVKIERWAGLWWGRGPGDLSSRAPESPTLGSPPRGFGQLLPLGEEDPPL